MAIDKSIKVGVISSLIASVIFLYLLDPLLNIMSNLFFYLNSKISSYFIDNLYKEIAVGKSDYSLTQMSIFIGVLSIILTTIIFRNINKTSRVSNKQTDKKEDTTKVRSTTLLKNTIQILLIVFINSIAILQLVSSHIKVSSINTFDQRIRIISPYITPMEKQLFISRFSSMRTYNQYKVIMRDIENLAKEKKIYLPEQLYTYTY